MPSTDGGRKVSLWLCLGRFLAQAGGRDNRGVPFFLCKSGPKRTKLFHSAEIVSENDMRGAGEKVRVSIFWKNV
jgi:hypothetical protein